MRLYDILLVLVCEICKMLYLPLLKLLLALAVIFSLSYVFGQETIPFTPEEVQRIAKHNLERKECIELREIDKQHIDSLNLKVNLLESKIYLKDTTINNFRSVVSNYEKIDNLRVEQNKELIKASDEQKEVIKKQNRKLNFWRIFTPVTVTAVTLGNIFIK